MKTINHIMGKPAFTTTQISKMLGINLSAKFIEEELGIKPDERTHNSVLWMTNKFNYICYQLSQHAYQAGMEFVNNLQEESNSKPKAIRETTNSAIVR